MTDNDHRITAHLVPETDRADFARRLFGLNFPLRLEPTIFSMAARLSLTYTGGLWLFHALSNGGFYMAPDDDRVFDVVSENGFEGTVSADAFGVTVCLYAYSHPSFGRGEFAEVCADQYHLLREFAMDHPEAGAIMAACD